MGRALSLLGFGLQVLGFSVQVSGTHCSTMFLACPKMIQRFGELLTQMDHFLGAIRSPVAALPHSLIELTFRGRSI